MTLGTIVHLIVVLALGWLFTWKVAPRLFVLLGRAFGFRMRFTPVMAKRITRFKRIRRGYWSFRAVTTAFVLSLFLELIVNNRPLVVHYGDRTAFPAVAEWVDGVVPFVSVSPFQKKSDFGQVGESEVDYRAFARWCDDPSELRGDIDKEKAAIDGEREEWLRTHPQPPDSASAGKKKTWQASLDSLEKRLAKRAEGLVSMDETYQHFAGGDAWCLMPLYPYRASEIRSDITATYPASPSPADALPLGTDLAGRDVLTLLLYGFRISLAFAILVAFAGYVVGIVVGALQGYYGGWLDILSQRVVEIWTAIPFLFVIMILASMVQPTFLVLVGLFVVLRAWIGITYYVRGEYLREKAKDYVHAAVGSGVRDRRIILKHILPNSLVPVVSLAPFAIVAHIGGLVSLDYLGFGLPPGTPSWGALLRQGLENVRLHPHLVVVPTTALAVTLFSVVMIGEAVREAFDPKVFARLR